jgi:hypothetical protein
MFRTVVRRKYNLVLDPLPGQRVPGQHSAYDNALSEAINLSLREGDCDIPKPGQIL